MTARVSLLCLLVASCISPAIQECVGGFLCPSGKVCAPDMTSCLFPEQLSECRAPRVDGDPCSVAGASGVCRSGVCQLEGTGCGNGVLDPGELCDDGNTSSCDGCSSDCQSTEICGNGINDHCGEACDCGDGTGPLPPNCLGPNSDSHDAFCSTTCELLSCGNGQLDLYEICDDGNKRSCDGCSSDCQSDERCGNGIRDCNEGCDCGTTPGPVTTQCNGPNSDAPTASCSQACQLPGCGDGMLSAPEVCEGTNLGGMTCASMGGIGQLACTSSCTWDFSHCDRWHVMGSFPGVQLNAIWGSGAKDVFAVGPKTTILHYDGSAWSQMAIAPSIGSAITLHGIWGSGPSDVFAVGDAGAVLHYNGTAWSAMTSSTSANLSGVWGSGLSNVFVFGRGNAAFHYNGAAWSAIPLPVGLLSSLVGVWGSAPNDIYAGGTDMILPELVHYDGSSWSSSTPNVGAKIKGLWGSGPSDIFAPGEMGAMGHFDGATWTFKTITAQTHLVTGCWGSGPSDVFAVGAAGTIVHYDGSSWTATPSGTSSDLTGIWGSGQRDVFAIGTNTVTGGLILHLP